MPDLISRDALKQFPVRRDHYDEENGNENFISGVESVLEYAEQLPTVDAVPVVRCKDCRYSRERHENECFYLAEGVLICTSSEATDDCWNAVWPDHFCSYGERRNDNAAD